MFDHSRNDRGKELLAEAIAEAETQKDSVTLIGASCAMGNLYFQERMFYEARPLRRRVVELVESRGDDVCAEEGNRARSMIDAMTP